MSHKPGIMLGSGNRMENKMHALADFSTCQENAKWGHYFTNNAEDKVRHLLKPLQQQGKRTGHP